MTSKVLVKLPTVPFSQGKKSTPELMSLPARNDGVATPLRSQQTPGNGDRTAQLEQNMKFLQEQHQATLVALHQEVETLRQRNRDLQFQLVFTKGTACTNSPSSPEDNSSGFVKPKIELLERDLEELKVSFNDVKKQNVHLLEIIEQQKLKLEQTAKEKEKLKVTDAAIQVEETNSVNSELVARLEDAELLVKKLQRENSEQQREISTIKASSAKNTGGNRSGHGRGRGNNDNGHHSRGSSGDPGQSSRNSYNFPPLESESYWRNVTRGRPSYDRQSGHHRRNRMDKKDSEQPDMSRHIVLPELLNSNVKPEIPCYPQFYPRSSRGYHNGGGGSAGGNYYRDSGNRKFRGQGRQRDRRDQQDSRGDHRDYRDRNSRDQSRDFNDGAHMSKKQ
ncbi:uncharacterized protein LOC123260301 isoform X2 [Cotesia glomerata]|uniref:CCDC92/74 N-terminal domain-containing protein n=1 Tax=Cotesia glomerata TaxID=32391 RepID=A0AAV7J999_COTGL|nr:uncharacterized protein LOC123260301 isoform X2 [Cotesia glomerata]KAH0569126.1 hypothetical protein KQX54_021834 [Cotesia glomerata]